MQEPIEDVKSEWYKTSVFQRPVRTNNDCEGRHFHLNAKAWKNSLPLYVLIRLLHREATTVTWQMRQHTDATAVRGQGLALSSCTTADSGGPANEAVDGVSWRRALCIQVASRCGQRLLSERCVDWLKCIHCIRSNTATMLCYCTVIRCIIFMLRSIVLDKIWCNRPTAFQEVVVC